MKSLIAKLFPGALFVAVVALVIAGGRAQSAANPTPPAPVTAAAPSAQGVTLCGSCGAELGAPQVVYVAQAVRGSVRQGGNGYGQPFYGMPPVVQAAPVEYAPAGYYYDGDGTYYRPAAPRQSIYPLSTQWAIPAHQIPPYQTRGHQHGRGCVSNCRY